MHGTTCLDLAASPRPRLQFDQSRVHFVLVCSKLQILPDFQIIKQVPEFARRQVSWGAHRLLRGSPLRVLAVQLRCIGGQLQYHQEDCREEASAKGCGPSGDLALALLDTDSRDPSLRSN